MKYLRLIFTEGSFILRWVIILLIGGVILFQKNATSRLDQHVSRIKAQNMELIRLAKLRDSIKSPETSKSRIVRIPMKQRHYILEGSSLQLDTFQAVINGEVYRSGDRIDEFVVHTITLNSAILVHKSTGQRKILQFQGPTIVQN